MRADITYVVIDTLNYELSAHALEKSQALFPLEKSIIFSDQTEPWNGRNVILIEKIQSVSDYNRIVFQLLPMQLETDYALFIQYDGYVMSGDLFSDQYLHWDYIGAPWPHHSQYDVGNGGFSLRSKKLVNAVQKFLLPSDYHSAEDIVICRYLRARLEDELGLKFAPHKIAEMFSFELKKPEFRTFGFHGIFNLPEVMLEDLDILFANLKPQSVAKFFRAFRNSCNELPHDGQKLFDKYCEENQSELLFHAKANVMKQCSKTHVM